MTPLAYVDPNITRPITTPDVPQTLADQFPAKTMHARTDVYDVEGTDFEAATPQPPLPNPNSYWTLARDLYANQGAVGQPFFN